MNEEEKTADDITRAILLDMIKKEMLETLGIDDPRYVGTIANTITAALMDRMAKIRIGRWRPMNTAPKDGTKILLCYHCGPDIGVSECVYMPEVAGCRSCWEIGHLSFKADLATGEDDNIIAWMPMPEPPGDA